MRPAVCIPYRATDWKRERALSVTAAFWNTLGWPVYLGDSHGETFDRAAAINAAALQAPEADVLVITDCDIRPVTQTQVLQACETALRENCYTMTYSQLLVLNEEATALLALGEGFPEQGIIERTRNLWIASFAVPRALFDECDGFDERFIDYGGEDIAFLMTAGTLGSPPQRVDGSAYHLSHDPMDKSHEHALANGALAKRYRSAAGKADQVRALIEERHA